MSSLVSAAIKVLVEQSAPMQEAEQPIAPEVDLTDKEDVVSVNVPLLIRMLEWAREDANSDEELHQVATNMISMSKDGEETLTMDNYDDIIATPPKFEAAQESMRYKKRNV